MRLGLTTVAILLAFASRGDARPSESDTKPAEIVKTNAQHVPEPATNVETDSRYIIRRKMSHPSSVSSRMRRDNVINKHKLNLNNARFKWQGHSSLSGLSFESENKKSYLPLGALSSFALGVKAIEDRKQPVGRSISHNPLAIPLVSSSRSLNSMSVSPLKTRKVEYVAATTTKSFSFTKANPISVPVKKISIEPNDYKNLNSRHRVTTPIPVKIFRGSRIAATSSAFRERKRLSHSSTPKPIPVKIPDDNYMRVDKMLHDNRQLGSRTLVRIVPTHLKFGSNGRRNVTGYKTKPPPIEDIHLKNWPNEALQNVHDLLNYEKYTTFDDDDDEKYDKDKNDISEDSFELHELNKISTAVTESTNPIAHWTKPTTTVSNYSDDQVDIDTKIQIDNLLEDLGKSKYPYTQTSSEIKQNTVVQIVKPNIKKQNVTFDVPAKVKLSKNKTETARPQKVHIMFYEDKSNGTSKNQPLPADFLGLDDDCPTIMINSLTQINNTIESKEGCSDLNIVINSHVLNTNILKPGSTSAQKDPGPATGGISSNFQTYPSTYPPSNYYDYPSTYSSVNYPSNNYHGTNKNPSNFGEAAGSSSGSDNAPVISTVELIQNTQINIGSNTGQAVADVQNEAETGNLPPALGGSTGTNSDGSVLTNSNDVTSDILGTAASNDEIVSDNLPGTPLATVPATASDVGTAESIGGPSPGISLPDISNVPSIPGATNLLESATGGQSGITSNVGSDDDEDVEDELIEAISPAGLLDSMSSVFNSFSVLNPVNYGIFGIAVAPFMAFAAGVVGIAAFLFPWAFPGSLDFARTLSTEGPRRKKFDFYTNLRNVVHSSIYKYTHLNEWKGRRRKRKRKR